MEAGKSTLLRLIFRIIQQNEGQVKLYGKPVEQYKKKELYHQMGLVFQNPENQFVTNSVIDEMMFSLKKERISRKEKEDRVFSMLRQFHLEKDKDKSPFVLSQGQKRRLSVATMLLTEQKILFLDEPTYGQDFENRHELMKDMQTLNENGTTIIMITHDLSLVRDYARRVIEIQNGRTTFDSTSKAYFDELVREGRGYGVCVY
ncbi:MAG: ABC transporter ATP-binding protein [Muricomes sp.]